VRERRQLLPFARLLFFLKGPPLACGSDSAVVFRHRGTHGISGKSTRRASRTRRGCSRGRQRRGPGRCGGTGGRGRGRCTLYYSRRCGFTARMMTRASRRPGLRPFVRPRSRRKPRGLSSTGRPPAPRPRQKACPTFPSRDLFRSGSGSEATDPRDAWSEIQKYGIETQGSHESNRSPFPFCIFCTPRSIVI